MRMWLRGLLPLVLLGLLLVYFFRFGPLGVLTAAFPPVEELTIDRILLPEPDRIEVLVTNGGADPVTIAQVQVDEAFWAFEIDPPEQTLQRLSSARIRLNYPWVEGEAHQIRLLTSTGLTFDAQIEVATQTPGVTGEYIVTFALLGLYAGVIPVFLGLLWYPFLRELSSEWLLFFLSLTAGLLFFLAVDTLEGALETAEALPAAYQGVGLIVAGALGTLLLLLALSRSKGRADKSSREGRIWTSLMIAVGIGLHNLGEGLAIGSAYALGEISLGTFLVVGFTLHNLTEGLGIVAPIARDRPSIARLVRLGAVAGLPTILGAWIGGFSYSAFWATLFLAVGAGAIVQVLVEILRLVQRQSPQTLATAHNVAGFIAGIGIMYLTGLLVVA